MWQHPVQQEQRDALKRYKNPEVERDIINRSKGFVSGSATFPEWVGFLLGGFPRSLDTERAMWQMASLVLARKFLTGSHF